jgi:hypothetical protein
VRVAVPPSSGNPPPPPPHPSVPPSPPPASPFLIRRATHAQFQTSTQTKRSTQSSTRNGEQTGEEIHPSPHPGPTSAQTELKPARAVATTRRVPAERQQPFGAEDAVPPLRRTATACMPHCRAAQARWLPSSSPSHRAAMAPQWRTLPSALRLMPRVVAVRRSASPCRGSCATARTSA